MAKFRLVKVAPNGRTAEITDSFESESLIEVGTQLTKKNPGVNFAVLNEQGFILWPEHLKRNTALGSAGWG